VDVADRRLIGRARLLARALDDSFIGSATPSIFDLPPT